MLQIISKKFFKSDNPETYHSTNEKTLIYSNIDIRDEIITSIATLERIESNNGITTYLMRYTINIEKQEGRGFRIVAAGHEEIVNDFICCCTLWFGKIFSTDKFYIQKLIRKGREGVADNDPPRIVLPIVFGETDIDAGLVAGLDGFIKSLILLKRDEYIAVMKVIRQFYDAVILVNSNLELSYMLFVATIEALAQGFDMFEAEWEDCPDKMTKRLDIIFESISEEISNEIKKVIMEETYNKLAKRYEEFAMSFVTFDYFLNIPLGAVSPIRKSYLRKAVKNSYIIRSKYVHSLKQLPDMIKLIGESETCGIGNMPYFTFSGLHRFCRYVIVSTMNSREKVEKEDFPYFSCFPGSLVLELDTKHWIFKEGRLTITNVTSYFNKFIDYFLKVRLKLEDGIVDLRNVCKKIEEIFSSINDASKSKLLIIYVLYNTFVEEKSRIKSSEKFIDKNQKHLETSTIENFIFYVLYFPIGKTEDCWDINELESIYQDYRSKRFWKQTTIMPQIIEVCLLLELANQYLKASDFEQYDKYVSKAIEEKPGDDILIHLFESIKSENRELIDWGRLFKLET